MIDLAGHASSPVDAVARQRTPIIAARPTTLRELGYHERWLQDWLAADHRGSELAMSRTSIKSRAKRLAGY
jgi:hypothetical protein